jgi:hyperosmotically inducible protein
MVARKILLTVFACLALSTASFAATTPADSKSSSNASKSEHPLSDSAITAKVKTALIAKKDLKSMHIHVETRNGVVTLTGSVPSKDQADAAVEAAKGVDGVKDVTNTLETKTASK